MRWLVAVGMLLALVVSAVTAWSGPGPAPDAAATSPAGLAPIRPDPRPLAPDVEPVRPEAAAVLPAAERVAVANLASPARRDGRVHGFAFDRRTGVGVAGCEILLLAGDERASVITGADGGFELPAGSALEPTGYGVKLDEPWRWRREARRGPEPLTAEQRAGQRPVVVEVAETHEGPVTGRAVSTHTGEPLRQACFKLRRGYRSQTITTDDRGEFATTREFRGGLLEVHGLGGFGAPAARSLDVCIGEPIELAFDVAGEVRLELSGDVPEDPTSLRLRVFLDGGLGLWNQSTRPTPVRRDDDGTLWAQPPGGQFTEGRPVVYAVSNADETIFGFARRGWTLAPRSLQIELARAAAILVHATRDLPDEEPPARIVELYGPDAAQSWLEQRYSAPLEHRYELLDGEPWPRSRSYRGSGPLRPGRYRVTTWTRHNAPVSAVVEARGGETTEVALHVPLRDDTVDVVGRIRTESGEPHDRMQLTIVGGDGGTYVLTEPGRCVGADRPIRRGDDGTGTFHVRHVAAGDVSIEPSRSRLPVRIEVEEREGRIEVDVLQLDGSAGGMAFRFGEEASRSITLQTRVHDGGAPFPETVTRNVPVSRDAPHERRFEWALRSSGMRPVYGDQNDFVHAGDHLWLADVAFERGWSTRVQVEDEHGVPIPGAAVLVDGRDGGRTDGRGHLELVLDEPPRSLQAVGAPGLESETVWRDEERFGSAWQTLVLRAVDGPR